MVLALFILGVILIGWFVPRLIVMHVTAGPTVLVGVVAALALGAGFIWVGAQLAEALGVEAARSAFDRGFNAWKVMLLLAPAAALQARRAMAKDEG